MYLSQIPTQDDISEKIDDFFNKMYDKRLNVKIFGLSGSLSTDLSTETGSKAYIAASNCIIKDRLKCVEAINYATLKIDETFYIVDTDIHDEEMNSLFHFMQILEEKYS